MAPAIELKRRGKTAEDADKFANQQYNVTTIHESFDQFIALLMLILFYSTHIFYFYTFTSNKHFCGLIYSFDFLVPVLFT